MSWTKCKDRKIIKCN